MNFNQDYSNITDPTCALSLHAPIILAINSASNTNPVYVDLTAITPAISITNLEMCKYNIDSTTTTNIIDLQPFLANYFRNEPELFDQNADWLITVQATVHTQGESNLVITMSVLNNQISRGTNPIVAYPQSWTVQASGKPTGVYTSEVATNDFSDLYLPADVSTLFLQPTYKFDAVGGYTVTCKKNLVTVYSTTATIDVTKYITQSPWTITLGTRNVRRQHFCPTKTPIIAYQNRYNYFEYLCLSDVYTMSKEVNQNPRIAKPFDNFRKINRSSWNGGEETLTFTFSITPDSALMIEKLKDIASTKKMYLCRNVIDNQQYPLTSENSWVEVEFEYTPTINSKYDLKETKRQTITVKIKENIY